MKGRVSNVVEEHDGKEKKKPKSKPVPTKQSFIQTWEAGVYQITRLNLVLNAVNKVNPDLNIQLNQQWRSTPRVPYLKSEETQTD